MVLYQGFVMIAKKNNIFFFMFATNCKYKWSLISMLILFTACQSLYAKTFTDIAGRIIELPSNVNNAIAIGPGCLRLIAYMKAVDYISGVERAETKDGWIEGRPYSLAIKNRIKDLPIIGQGGPGTLPNLEKIIEIKPDVIFASSMDLYQIKKIEEKTGIPVVVLSYGDSDDLFNVKVKKSLSLIASILDRGKREKELLDFINTCLIDLQKRSAETDTSKTFTVYLAGLSYKGKHGLESTRPCYPPFKILNLKSIVDDLKCNNHIFIDKELIIERNPDYIFIDTNSLDIIKNDYLKNKKIYHLLTAIKKGNVHMILPYNSYNTNMEIALVNVYLIGKILFPKKFENINIEEKAGEIIKFFTGRDSYKQISSYFGSFQKLIFSGDFIYAK